MTMTRIKTENTFFLTNSTDNDTANGNKGQYWDDIITYRIIAGIVLGFIAVAGMVGNTLTVAVVLRQKDNKSITDILITSLAVADILFIVFCVPFDVVSIAMARWPFGIEWCLITVYFTHAFAYAGMYTLVLISFDKYLALAHPIRSLSLRTKKYCYVILTVMWSIILFGNMPMIFGSDGKDFTNRNPLCIKGNPLGGSLRHWFCIFFFVFGFLLPVILMCALYGKMLKIFLTGNIPGKNIHTSRVLLQTKQRVTKMVITVVTVFIICWAPFHVVSLYSGFNYFFGNIFVFHLLYIFAMCMSYVNSCINPMLYTFYSKTFRKRFSVLLCCKKEI